MDNNSSGSNNNMAAIKQKNVFEGIRLENPFAFKVGQVFTGFGIGCGIGIGLGRPINLGAIPMVGQVMSATRGATDALSGVSRHVNGALRKLGAKNIEAGIGCGVGIGHGFGISDVLLTSDIDEFVKMDYPHSGLAVKPGVLHQIQCSAIQAMTNMMIKFGMAPNLPFTEGASLVSLQSEPSTQSPFGRNKQVPPKQSDFKSQGLFGPGNMSSSGSAYENFPSKSPTETSFGSRTEKVLNSFMQNSVLKEDETKLNELAGQLQSENNLLQLVLKHQQIIDQLMEENQKLQQVLTTHLKIPPSELQTSYSSRIKYPCSECFYCRRKQRKNR